MPHAFLNKKQSKNQTKQNKQTILTSKSPNGLD